jgi:alpha-glucuronidase
MKKLLTVLALSFFVTATMPMTVMAGAKKGQKIFKKKFRKKCGFSGVRFARNHTQAEWEKIWEKGKFQEEAKKICPRLDVQKIKAKWWEDVYEFSHKYASDGVVPKC